MNLYKTLSNVLVIIGAFDIGCFLIVDIYGPERINPAYAIVGILVIMLGCNELNHIQTMDKLNEEKN